MVSNYEREQIDTVVIGGGQAGLAVGHELAERGRPFVILDASARVGDAWRNRWDSLRLFTPARFNGLPGRRFPASGGSVVTKDQMADYLEDYARHFELPVRNGKRVDCLTRRGEGFVVRAGDTEFEAANGVVAMANYQVPRVPSFARELSAEIRQVHSGEYRNLSQLRDGPVLIVGAGNSGADIGMEVVQQHRTWMAGDHPGHVPFRIEPWLARFLLVRLVRFAGHHVLNTGTPMGRRMRPLMIKSGGPLVRVKPNDLVRAGVTRVPRVTGVEGGLPVLEDGTVLEVANVIWCTGSRPGFSWIDLPVFQDGEEPDHHRGIVDAEPGLYFVGLNFLYAATSDTVTGVARDAKHVVRQLVARASDRGGHRADRLLPQPAGRRW